MKAKLKRYLSTLKKELGNNIDPSLFDTLKDAIDSLEEKNESTVLDTSTFEIPKEVLGKEMSVAIFSDGACRGNPGPGAWACVAQDHTGHILFELSEVETLTTNNQMELKGALEGMLYLKHKIPNFSQIDLHVFTDSQYLVNGMNSWVVGWKNRGWKKADKKAPENLEIWQQLDSIRNDFKSLRFHWVKGHAGHPQNEFCDRLANIALDNEGH